MASINVVRSRDADRAVLVSSDIQLRALTSPRDCDRLSTLLLLLIGYAVMARQGGALGAAGDVHLQDRQGHRGQAIAAHWARQADRCGSAQTSGPGPCAATGSSAPQGAW